MRVSRIRKMFYSLIIAFALMPVAVCAGEKNAPSYSPPVQARLLTDREYFDVLRKGINEANAEIVVCAYLFKTLEGADGYPERIVQSLSAAVKRGVRVSAVMELSQKSGDLLEINAKTARRLEQAGIKVCPDPENAVTHTKLVIIDRRFLLVGSHNLTQSALRYNHEASIWIDSPAMAAEALDYLSSLCGVKKRGNTR
jgi:phosphatidylserine/phosphatidylglycerophosphate/cardiolipin synthase-like enzyme